MKIRRKRPRKDLAGCVKEVIEYGFKLAEPIREEEIGQAFACWRKKYYGTEEKAWQAAKECESRESVYPYPCEYCKGWHLAKVRRKRRA